MRRACCTFLHALMKLRNGDAAGAGICADFIEGQQTVITIESGIFQRLGHHRAGELLDLERKAANSRDAVSAATRGDQVERENIAQEVEDIRICAEPVRARRIDGLDDDRPILPTRTGRRNVGAVDREMHNEKLKRQAQTLGGVVAS